MKMITLTVADADYEQWQRAARLQASQDELGQFLLTHSINEAVEWWEARQKEAARQRARDEADRERAKLPKPVETKPNRPGRAIDVPIPAGVSLKPLAKIPGVLMIGQYESPEPGCVRFYVKPDDVLSVCFSIANGISGQLAQAVAERQRQAELNEAGLRRDAEAERVRLANTPAPIV